MTTMTMMKYAIALLGLAVIFGAERIDSSWLGYVGLALIVLAFFLRFVRRGKGPEDAG